MVLELYKGREQTEILRHFLLEYLLPLFSPQTFNCHLLWHLTKSILQDLSTLLPLSALFHQDLLLSCPALFPVLLSSQNSLGIVGHPSLQAFYRQLSYSHVTCLLVDLSETDFPRF